MSTFEDIELQLEKLVGLPTWGAAFAATMLTVQFGAKRKRINRRGNPVEVGQYALHIQESWRLSDGDNIVVGELDHQCNELIDNTEIILGYVTQALATEPTVTSIRSLRAGAFSLMLESSQRLEVFPTSGRFEKMEFWRLLSPAVDSPHFVVTSTGVE